MFQLPFKKFKRNHQTTILSQSECSKFTLIMSWTITLPNFKIVAITNQKISWGGGGGRIRPPAILTHQKPGPNRVNPIKTGGGGGGFRPP